MSKLQFNAPSRSQVMVEMEYESMVKANAYAQEKYQPKLQSLAIEQLKKDYRYYSHQVVVLEKLSSALEGYVPPPITKKIIAGVKTTHNAPSEDSLDQHKMTMTESLGVGILKGVNDVVNWQPDPDNPVMKKLIKAQDKVEEKYEKVKTSIKNKMDGITTSISNKFGAMTDSVGAKFDKVANNISDGLGDVKDAIVGKNKEDKAKADKEAKEEKDAEKDKESKTEERDPTAAVESAYQSLPPHIRRKLFKRNVDSTVQYLRTALESVEQHLDREYISTIRKECDRLRNLNK